MNNYSSGYKFVVDTPFSALFLSCLVDRLGHPPSGIILESKIGIDNPDFHFNALKTLIASYGLLVEREVTLPSHYFITDSASSRIDQALVYRKFKKNILKIISPSSSVKYIGSSTSSLLRAIRNPIFFDHGASDYLYDKKSENCKGKAYNFIFSLFGASRVSYSSFVYTPFPYARLKKFVDLYSYDIPTSIKQYYSSCFPPEYSPVTLLLPRSGWHLGPKMPMHDDRYDESNLKLVNEHCSRDQLILIKYHPSVYQGSNVQDLFTSKCRRIGYNVVNVDECLPRYLRGRIPAEILIKLFSVKKIVSAGSSVPFNYCHLKSLSSIIDMRPFSFQDQLRHQQYLGSLYSQINLLIPHDRRVRLLS